MIPVVQVEVWDPSKLLDHQDLKWNWWGSDTSVMLRKETHQRSFTTEEVMARLAAA